MRLGSLRDFAIALLLVLACNLLVLGSIDRRAARTPRKLSHDFAAARISQLSDVASIDLVIFGDSRALRIPADQLCEALGMREASCLNLATTGGDWITAYDLFSRLEPHLDAGSRLLVCLSDYWLEGGPESELELLPETMTYAALGQWRTSIASYLPLSVARGGRMRWLHDQLAGYASALEQSLAPRPLEDPATLRTRTLQRVERSNVDAWYAPSDDETRRAHRRVARRALTGLRAAGADVMLVNLPNPAAREAYVDQHFPGRRQRYREAAARLGEEFGIPFLDLAGRLDERTRYRDYHHLNDESLPELVSLLAQEIAGAPARSSSQRR